MTYALPVEIGCDIRYAPNEALTYSLPLDGVISVVLVGFLFSLDGKVSKAGLPNNGRNGSRNLV